jgi:hypothetical protein
VSTTESDRAGRGLIGKSPGQLGGFFALVFPGRLPKFANSQIQNRPLLDSKTEFNGVGESRTYIKNCVGGSSRHY